MKIEKVTLIGLGAMGVFFAPRISEKLGAGFRILADGARKERLEHKGVTVNQINYRFPIITPDLEGDPADLIIIAVKGYDLPQALKDIKNQVGEHTIILSVLNGVESEKELRASKPKRTEPSPLLLAHPPRVTLLPARAEKLELGAKTLLVMSVATSIDALAVGVSFAFLAVDIWLAVALIGATTFLISLAGVLVGTKAGGKFRGKAELAGGVLLFLIGLKILLEHLGVISF